MSHEMFLLAVFGIVICGNLTSNGDPLKGWISGFIGLLMSQVGLETIYSYKRFTFGNMNLSAGISLSFAMYITSGVILYGSYVCI